MPTTTNINLLFVLKKQKQNPMHIQLKVVVTFYANMCVCVCFNLATFYYLKQTFLAIDIYCWPHNRFCLPHELSMFWYNRFVFVFRKFLMFQFICASKESVQHVFCTVYHVYIDRRECWEVRIIFHIDK